jgi:hypothetical protein
VTRAAGASGTAPEGKRGWRYVTFPHDRQGAESDEENDADQWRSGFLHKDAVSVTRGVACAARQAISGILTHNFLARFVNKEQTAGTAPRGAMPISSHLDGEQFDPETQRNDARKRMR